MWLPVCRRNTHPSRSKARRASRPLATGRSGNGDVDLDRADGERQSLLRPDLKAGDDRLAWASMRLTHRRGMVRGRTMLGWRGRSEEIHTGVRRNALRQEQRAGVDLVLGQIVLGKDRSIYAVHARPSVSRVMVCRRLTF